jgi:RimJ/RimL family protein N-acetyltransferase
MFELRTERLTFRHGTASDVEAIHAIVSDWDVVKNLGSWPFPADLGYTINRIVNQPDRNIGFAGIVRAGDERVGGMGIVGGDLGYSFGRAHWGKGYATEMSRRLVDYAFDCFNWPQLTSEAYVDNPASSRVLAKVGFEPAGTAMAPCAARGGDFEVHRFILARERWDALRNSGQ